MYFIMKVLYRMIIWFLGCVLFSFVMWIVFGLDGYDEYYRFCFCVICVMLMVQIDEGVLFYKCGFYDGFVLLQLVKDWYQFLCFLFRLLDIIIGKVLDFIEVKLLVNDFKE